MKKLLFIILLFWACKKEITTEPNSTSPAIIGRWYIVPVGNPTDSFSYFITSPSHPESSYIPDFTKSGKVSNGSFQIHLTENSNYRIYYKGIDSTEKFLEVATTDTLYYKTDSLPATIY